MRCLIVGGTGFIGYHAVWELVRRGHEVSVLALPPPPTAGGDPCPPLFPPQIRVTLADLATLPDADVQALLAGHDAVVYAAGADDRITPRRPAYDFFYRANVEATARFFALARAAGVRRGVVLGSYFTYFDRTWPHLALARHHPYIRSRVEQANAALAAAGPELAPAILELPYIFGAMPGRLPLWAPLIRYIASPLPLVYPAGGTNMIAVGHVAEAIAGALERGQAGARYVIGDENLAWADWLGRLTRLVGREKRVITAPAAAVRGAARCVRLYHRLQGREGGLDPVAFVALQTADTFFDPAPSRAELGYGRGGLDEALDATVRACRPAAGARERD